ncbi:MAG: ribonuclease P protein component [Nibricoccus sp.]
MRFRAEQHLRRQSDFRNVREKGRRQDCGAFTLWWFRRPSVVAADSPNPSPASDPAATCSRVGVVAAGAVVGKAVQRNRAKRRLRALFREHQTLVPPEYDLLMVARNSFNRWEYRLLEQKFIDACRKTFPKTDERGA